MLVSWLQRAVSFSARRPLAIAAGVAVLVALALGYAATHFDMTTDTGALISDQTDWRKNESAVGAAFPGSTIRSWW